jgi:Nucleotidyltransferase of unknown function (DUF6036)
VPALTHTVNSPLWSMALGGLPIDAGSLASAIENEISQPIDHLDFRTRLLIRDSLEAMEIHWGRDKVNAWLTQSPHRAKLDAICNPDLGEAGFPSFAHRIMDTVKPRTVLQFLRELGIHCPQPARLEIGGAIAGILAGMLSPHTEDIDVVDEVPIVLRSQHEMLDELANRFGLRLTHFRSHYPTGWQDRLRLLDHFGNLEVLMLDPHDLFIGKLFSQRIKDRDDLGAMPSQLDKAALENRFRESTSALRNDSRLAKFAAENWYILYGQSLPC